MHVSDMFSNKESTAYSSTWASKISSSGKMTKLNGWTPVRLSGRLRFNKKKQQPKSGEAEKNANNNNNNTHVEGTSKRFSRKSLFPGCAHQFHQYCQHTSLHGFRYVTEEKRALSERYVCTQFFIILQIRV